MTKITPLFKGVITSVLMISAALMMYYTNQPAGSPLQYLTYILYAGGIMWTLLEYSRSPAYKGKFGELFGQGFRCFIVVTLAMVIFTAVFTIMHPEMAEESAGLFREDLVKRGDRLPKQIDQEVKTYKDQFVTRLVSIMVFGYLIMGAIFTVAASAGVLLLTRRK
jgi:hypothetical protein